MKRNRWQRFLYLLLPVALMIVGFGGSALSAYQHRSLGMAMLNGVACVGSVGLWLDFFSLGRKPQPPAV